MDDITCGLIRQKLLFEAAWAPLVEEHNEVRRSERCSSVNGKLFAVVGIHMRLGDVASKFSETQRLVCSLPFALPSFPPAFAAW